MSDQVNESAAYTGPAILELLGHRRYGGVVSQVQQYGTTMGRLDVYEAEGQPAQTIYFGGGSVYQLSPVSEEAARAVCQYSRPKPVHPYELTPHLKALSPAIYWCPRCSERQVYVDGQLCDPCAADVEEDVYGRDDDEEMDDPDVPEMGYDDADPNEEQPYDRPRDPFVGAVQDLR